MMAKATSCGCSEGAKQANPWYHLWWIGSSARSASEGFAVAAVWVFESAEEADYSGGIEPTRGLQPAVAKEKMASRDVRDGGSRRNHLPLMNAGTEGGTQ